MKFLVLLFLIVILCLGACSSPEVGRPTIKQLQATFQAEPGYKNVPPTVTYCQGQVLYKSKLSDRALQHFIDPTVDYKMNATVENSLKESGSLWRLLRSCTLEK